MLSLRFLHRNRPIIVEFPLWFQLCLPAAKCRGVDLRPAMSLAFTFTASTSFFTLETSPFLQDSNSSLNAPLAAAPPLPPARALPESGVDPGLVPLPSVLVGELAVLLVQLLELLLELLLLLLLGLVVVAVVVGEAGVTSPSGALSVAAPWGNAEASSAGVGGETGGVTVREDPRGGEDSTEFDCCCC